MRLDVMIDSLYTLSALWGALPTSPVCPVRAPLRLPALRAVVGAPVSQGPAAVTAFVDVNVVPMDTERVLAHQTVLVQDGHITALGPSPKVPVPAGAVQIDGRGKYLIPGLADVHWHFYPGNDENDPVRHTYRHVLASYLAHGVTTIRSLQRFHPDEDQRREQERAFMPLAKGEGLGPRVYYPWLWNYLPQGAIRLDSVPSQLAAAKAVGYRTILTSLMPQVQIGSGPLSKFDLGERRALEDSLVTIARRLGLVLASHDHSATVEKLVTFGAYGGSNEHLWPFYAFLRQPGADTSAAGYLAMARAVGRAGTFISVTLNCQMDRQGVLGNMEVAQKIVKALQEGGVRLLVGSDVKDIGKSGASVHFELKNLVNAGLTPYQALVAGTRNVAEYLRLLDSSGTVAVGKRADLVLLHGNPLTDIQYAREPVGTMIAGRWFDRAALDQSVLVSPKLWFQSDFSGILPRFPDDWMVAEPYNALRRLTDSLSMVTPSDKAAYEQIARRITEAMGALRQLLTPAQRSTSFDSVARMWMREQARRGYPVTVDGVSPMP